MSQIRQGTLVRIKRSNMIGPVESIGPDSRVTVRFPLVKAVYTVAPENVAPLTQKEADTFCRCIEQQCQDAALYYEELGRAGWELWEVQKNTQS